MEVVINHAGGELSSLSSSSNSASNSSPPVIATEEIVEEEVTDNDGGRKIGRPLGSSKDKKKADADNLKSCINEIAYDYATKLTSQKGQKKRCPKGFLADLIAEKKTKYEVSSDIAIKTIRSRTHRNKLDPKHQGVGSPLEEAEKALVAICNQMGKIRQPVNVREGIALMTDLIKGTTMKEELKEFQIARKLGSKDFDYGTISRSWWRGFMRRHGHKVVSKRGEKFACVRADWTKTSNLQNMYNAIYNYNEFVDARIAIIRDVPVFTDRHGNEVEESEKFGEEQNIKITHPHYLLFADETGCSTSQKKDGHVGGQKYIVEKGSVPQTIASHNDHRFTILPFTSGSGEAVCLVVIFQHKSGQVPLVWQTGIDVRAKEPVRNLRREIDFETNIGEGKFYPGGKTLEELKEKGVDLEQIPQEDVEARPSWKNTCWRRSRTPRPALGRAPVWTRRHWLLPECASTASTSVRKNLCVI